MRTLVTGGAGFIGSTLVDRLLADGHDVTVVDNLASGRADNLTDALAGGRCAWERVDVTAPELADVVAAARPEVVFHLAAQISPRASVEDPVHDATVNVVGTVAVLGAALAAGARKLVYTSSAAIYGTPAKLPVTEDTPTNPLSPYAVSKLAGELYLRQFAELHGLASTAIAPGNVYGPRQDPHGEAGVVAIFTDALLTGRPTRLYGDGGNVRDYVYVDDVVDGFVRAAGEAATGLRVNIGTGVPTTDAELHAATARAVGVSVEPDLAPPRPGDLRAMVFDPSRARDLLGWTPRVDLETGLARVAAHRSASVDPLAGR